MVAIGTIQPWIIAARPRTLPLALASVGMGNFLAWFRGAFDIGILILAALTTVGLQVLSNLANDYGDSIHGADHAPRIGPPRMVQSGFITELKMKRAMWVMGILSLVSGVCLLLASFEPNQTEFYGFLILGLLAIYAAVSYTSGKKPYGYQGWGDLSVIIFFGLVAVTGTYYLQTKQFHWDVLLPALSCGLFATAVLNVNNLRDLKSDRLAGKRSIPVRVGSKTARRYHWSLLIVGMLSSLLFVALNYYSPWQLLFLPVGILLYQHGAAISRKKNLDLDPHLKQMAFSTLLYVILFGIGLVMSV